MSNAHSLEDLQHSARAFVINLDSRPDRMREFRARFDRFGFPIERVSACTPDTTTDWFAEARPGASPAEVACAASHHSIFRRMVDESIPWALVIEDDAIAVRDLPRRITWLFENWPDGCWYVQLGYSRGESLGIRGLARTLSAPFVRSANELRPEARRMGTHLSLVTLEFAQYILPTMRPGTWRFDEHLNHLKDSDRLGSHSYVHVPCLARQSRSPSDIQRLSPWMFQNTQRWIP